MLIKRLVYEATEDGESQITVEFIGVNGVFTEDELSPGSGGNRDGIRRLRKYLATGKQTHPFGPWLWGREDDKPTSPAEGSGVIGLEDVEAFLRGM